MRRTLIDPPTHPLAEGPARMQRRGFLARLGLGLVGTVVAGGASAQQAAHHGPGGDAWLERLRGKHRQIFDSPVLTDGKPLTQVRNYLDAYREAYGLGDSEVNAVVGVHGKAVPLVFQDHLWEKFSLGERFGVRDPESGAPAKRNVFRPAQPGGPVPAGASVEALQRRGVVFLLCDNSLKRLVGTLADAGLGTPAAVRAELLAGLLPGVEVVPAMVVALNLAQEKGLSYVYAG